MVISASRRTDILAYYSDFFENCLRKGFIEIQNPFNPHHIRMVSLKKEQTDAFVFWTRNALPSLPLLKYLEKKRYPFYVMITFTGYPTILERKSPSFDIALENFKKLSELFSRERVIWRYDPILFSNLSDKEFHLQNFRFITEKLSLYTKRVIVSIFDPYKFVLKRISKIEKLKLFNLGDEELFEFLVKIKEIAENFSLEIQSCCEGKIFEKAGIRKGACIDIDFLNRVFSLNLKWKKDTNQRENCLCGKSVDIGSYNTCLSQCLYCYANKKLYY